MNAGHAQVALGKSSTECAQSSKQEQEEPPTRTVQRHVLNDQILEKRTTRMFREHGSQGSNEKSLLSTYESASYLESERPFYHHDTMPTDLHPLNGIIVRLHLDKNP